jgi:hypothetical protein
MPFEVGLQSQHTKELQEKSSAAMKEQAAMMKTAAPKQLASKDVVRKSQKYWDAYHDDLIREIFDGGFGEGLGDDTQFELLFTHYVEAFSRDCRDALPAKHETFDDAIEGRAGHVWKSSQQGDAPVVDGGM